MDFNDFLKEALEPDLNLRQGQKLMINLHSVRNDLYGKIFSGSLDGKTFLYNCFYEDSKMWATIEWLGENWCKVGNE